MIIIKCAKCKRTIFKYHKLSKGKLWHCWKEQIAHDYSIRDGKEVKCACGNLIGIDQDKWIKLRRHSITYSGSTG